MSAVATVAMSDASNDAGDGGTMTKYYASKIAELNEVRYSFPFNLFLLLLLFDFLEIVFFISLSRLDFTHSCRICFVYVFYSYRLRLNNLTFPSISDRAREDNGSSTIEGSSQ